MRDAWGCAMRQTVSTPPVIDQTGVGRAAFHGERLRIAAGLTEGATLVNELLNFEVKVNIATGNESFEAWREGVHDDLVLAVAMAVWWGENRIGRPSVGAVAGIVTICLGARVRRMNRFI